MSAMRSTEQRTDSLSDRFSVLMADDPRWLSLWERWPDREVWAHPSYARLYEVDGAFPVCAVWESDEGCVLYPMVLRDLRSEPWWDARLGRATDIVSPYGYGGPFFWGRDRGSVAVAFWESFNSWAADFGAVSEFVRFTLFREHLLPYPGEQEVRLQNAVRTFTHEEPTTLWMDVKQKVRKNVKRARAEGVTIEFDPDGHRLGEFLSIYRQTMDRVGAGEAYHFSAGYFERISEELPGQHLFVHAFHRGRMVSTELIPRSATRAYSFLGGTDERAFAIRPNDLLRWEILLWAQEVGLRQFVLGGGLEMEDGILHHKLAFAPSGRMPFRVGRRVMRPNTYQRLVTARARADAEWSPSPGWFPAYRG
jgi:Acetyltransferase (GNAT) domain